MAYVQGKLRWLRRIHLGRAIAFAVSVSILLSSLALVAPHNLVGKTVLASPGPVTSVRNKGTVPDSAPKSREYVKEARYTANTRTQTSEGPKVCVKEFDIKIEGLEVSAKGEVCVKKVTTWTEREWKETKVTWLEQPWRKI